MDFLTNEMQRVSVDFKNTGSVPLTNIMIATSTPNLLSSCEFKDPEYYPGSDVMSREKWARKNHITSVPLPGDRLEPGNFVTVYMWVKAPDTKGPKSVDILIYYENIEAKAVPK